MIKASETKSWSWEGDTIPSMTAKLIFDEQCCVCNRHIPDKVKCLRNTDTKNIICILCIIDIAEVEI